MAEIRMAVFLEKRLNICQVHPLHLKVLFQAKRLVQSHVTARLLRNGGGSFSGRL